MRKLSTKRGAVSAIIPGILKSLIMFAFIMLCVPEINAQEYFIKGSVKDNNTHEPLIGVSVSIKGEAKGTITDYDGNFHIDKIANNSILERKSVV